MINEATAQYALRHADDDVRRLALRGCKDPQVDLALALQQIKGRQTARRKLPSWAAIDDIVYPPQLNMEQCSGELAASYKKEIAERLTANTGQGSTVNGQSLIDLTGGLGVDFAFMADAFDKAVYVERDQQLCQLAAHNLKRLGKENVDIVCNDAGNYLDSLATNGEPAYALAFLDPARRDNHGARTYALADCSPDVTLLMPQLLRCARHVMLKLSPMLDWRKAIDDLSPHAAVHEVHIVAVDNECKELLLLLSAPHAKDSGGAADTTACSESRFAPRMVCVDIHSRDGSRTAYSPTRPTPYPSRGEGGGYDGAGGYGGANGADGANGYSGFRGYSGFCGSVSSFLYEPNAAVMKAGCFGDLAADFGIAQLAPNSHLFTSPTPLDGFPGRAFRISAVTTMNKRDLRTALAHLQRANITVRNFPLSADQLRHRLKLADGGTDYIFATTLADGTHTLLLCTRLQTE